VAHCRWAEHDRARLLTASTVGPADIAFLVGRPHEDAASGATPNRLYGKFSAFPRDASEAEELDLGEIRDAMLCGREVIATGP
jgi:hypothetical protein